jgi:hypothetical protein
VGHSDEHRGQAPCRAGIGHRTLGHEKVARQHLHHFHYSLWVNITNIQAAYLIFITDLSASLKVRGKVKKVKGDDGYQPRRIYKGFDSGTEPTKQ